MKLIVEKFGRKDRIKVAIGNLSTAELEVILNAVDAVDRCFKEKDKDGYWYSHAKRRNSFIPFSLDDKERQVLAKIAKEMREILEQ